MSYSTPKMIRQALVPTSDGTPPEQATNTAADLTDTQLLDAIGEADSFIDAYIGKYYAVPVLTILAGEDEDGTTIGAVPHPVDYWSRNIAAYNATLTFRGSADFADTDPIARRYNATVAALTAVSKGTASLQIPENVSGNASTGAGQAINPYVGDLFDPRDWNLHPLNPDFPLWPDSPAGGSW